MKKHTKTYFTGRPCKRGHISKRYLSNRICCRCLPPMRRRNYLKNIERDNAQSKAWQIKNRKKAASLAAKYRKNNPEKCSYACKKWRLKNKDKVRTYMATKRAKRSLAIGKFTKEDIKNLQNKQRNKCNGCRRNIKKSFDVDHVMPLALGGTNWPKNLQLLCRKCNNIKHAKHPREWKKILKSLRRHK